MTNRHQRSGAPRPPSSSYGIGYAALLIAALCFVACATGVDPLGPPGGATTSSGGAGGSTSSTTSGTSTTTSTTTTTSSSGGGQGGASSSSSAGGSGGQGGASTSSSVGTGGAPDGLGVEYRCNNTTLSTQQVQPVFNIVNNGASAVPIADLTLRYYYTIDPGAAAQTFVCDFAQIGSGNVMGTFGAAAGVNADQYLELSFSGGDMIAAGGQSGEIQARFHKDDFSVFDQTNDYSFDASIVAFTTWDRVTLYHAGALVWGIEP
jgi:Cellulose binding domain